MARKMRIGELAKRAGVNVQTVRYYERRGLLVEPVRLPSGYREYTEDCLARLQFIRRAQGLGFTLSEIDSLLSLRQDSRTTAEQVRARAQEKIASVEQKIRDLQGFRQALQHLAGACEEADGGMGDCPLLDAMGPFGTGCAHHAGSPGKRVGTYSTQKLHPVREHSCCGGHLENDHEYGM